LIVNPPETITRSFLIQVIDTAANDGSDPAPLFGTAAEQAAIFSDVNQIWAQAGIEVNFEFLSGTWDNTFALEGTTGDNNPRPQGDLSTLVSDADSDLSLDSHANQLFMLQIVPDFSQEDSSTAVGYSFTAFNGMTMWIGATLPLDTDGQDVAASILAHEIGRNLGLTTDNADNEDLMNTGGSGGELLTSTQISDARNSQYLTTVTPVPEPSAAGLMAGAFLLVALFRRKGLNREGQRVQGVFTLRGVSILTAPARIAARSAAGRD
jgi:hypothetical protein